jgi:hypothetical protein
MTINKDIRRVYLITKAIMIVDLFLESIKSPETKKDYADDTVKSSGAH